MDLVRDRRIVRKLRSQEILRMRFGKKHFRNNRFVIRDACYYKTRLTDLYAFLPERRYHRFLLRMRQIGICDGGTAHLVEEKCPDPAEPAEGVVLSIHVVHLHFIADDTFGDLR